MTKVPSSASSALLLILQKPFAMGRKPSAIPKGVLINIANRTNNAAYGTNEVDNCAVYITNRVVDLANGTVGSANGTVGSANGTVNAANGTASIANRRLKAAKDISGSDNHFFCTCNEKNDVNQKKYVPLCNND